MKTTLITTIICVLLAGGGAFFAGMKYQQSQRPAFNRQFSNGQTRGIQGQPGTNRPVNGDIISNDDKSITVKMQDGSSKIVLVTDKTIINKASEATKTDLKTGEKVAVFGTTNSDGSVTAQNIQLNPVFRVGGGNGGTPGN